MPHRAELIYFDGCPNADDARHNLRAALAAEGLPPEWQERNQHDPRTRAASATVIAVIFATYSTWSAWLIE